MTENISELFGTIGTITLPKVKEMVKAENKEVIAKDQLSELETKLLLEAIKVVKDIKKEEVKKDKSLEEVTDEESEKVEDTDTTNISYGFTNADRFSNMQYADAPQGQLTPNYSGLNTEVESNVYTQTFGDDAYQGSQKTNSHAGIMSAGQAETTVHTLMTEYVMGNGAQNLSDVSAEERQNFKNWLLDPFNSWVLLPLYQNTGAIQTRNVDYR